MFAEPSTLGLADRLPAWAPDPCNPRRRRWWDGGWTDWVTESDGTTSITPLLLGGPELALDEVEERYQLPGLTLADLHSLREALAEHGIDTVLTGGVVRVDDHDLALAEVARDLWARARYQPTTGSWWVTTWIIGVAWLFYAITLVVVLSLRAYQLAGPPSDEVATVQGQIDGWVGAAWLAGLFLAAAMVAWPIHMVSLSHRASRTASGALPPRVTWMAVLGLAAVLGIAGFVAATFDRDNKRAAAMELSYPSVDCVVAAAMAVAAAVVGTAIVFFASRDHINGLLDRRRRQAIGGSAP